MHFKLCKTASKNESFKEWEAVLLRRMTDKWKRSFTYNLLKENEYEELCMEDKLDILIALCHWKLDDVALNEYCTEHMEEQEMMVRNNVLFFCHKIFFLTISFFYRIQYQLVTMISDDRIGILMKNVVSIEQLYKDEWRGELKNMQ